MLVATDGTDAWELYRQHDVDVIVSDWLMPGMDGLDLCRRVRASQRETYTYFMLLTSLEGKQHFMQGMQAGADDYLTKPLDREELQVRLQVASRVTSLHHQLAEKTRELETANHALAESARRDPLTGLGNRLQLREDLYRLQRWLDRYGRGFGVALCDVDHFKLYNDHYGHVAGDEVLQAISKTVAETIRSGDMAYRYGGEEILVIMPEQSAETSVIAMERVREAVEQLDDPARGEPAVRRRDDQHRAGSDRAGRASALDGGAEPAGHGALPGQGGAGGTGWRWAARTWSRHGAGPAGDARRRGTRGPRGRRARGRPN